MTHAELVALGAPPLPEGYFYRVEKTYDKKSSEPHFWVSIYKTVNNVNIRRGAREAIVHAASRVDENNVRWRYVLDENGWCTYHESDEEKAFPIQKRVELTAGELIAECARGVYNSWTAKREREEFMKTFDPYIGDHKC
jgi:hypothetical protein